MPEESSLQAISVIVPRNPFAKVKGEQPTTCLAALDVCKLMEWWPGKSHYPHHDARKVKFIQRSLDWRRVAQIAAYLLQEEVTDVPDRIRRYFSDFYNFDEDAPGWPPKVPRVVGFQPSEYPTFSNILVHVIGAEVESRTKEGTGKLVFSEKSKDLNFSVIDGQHRVNGAYLAVSILRESKPDETWRIPAQVFVKLDRAGEPRRQAQIFIDVNSYQKKVDRSLVADLFPTARAGRESLDITERAQDLGRKLMLEVGPLVGMIQIPGIKFGVKDVVTLATLNSAIESALPHLDAAGIESLDEQADFLAFCLDGWLEASGRREEINSPQDRLDPRNVAYQGRVAASAGADLSLTHEEAALFATAVVDMWGRSVHSFLISVAVTDVSPIWAIVSGYYSSHYSIRAIAHMVVTILAVGKHYGWTRFDQPFRKARLWRNALSPP